MHTRIMISKQDGRRAYGYASTEHSASSYGQPVVLIKGVPHGPSDMIGIIRTRDPELAKSLQAAGYTVVITSATDGQRNVFLPDDLYLELESRAKEMGVPRARLLAIIVRGYFGAK